MILKRRRPQPYSRRLKEALWPSMGFLRLASYYRHRIARLKGSPYYIASGFATGVAMSFTPLVGFHLMLAGVISWLIGGSLIAMALGALLSGNPWTYPFIWVSTYKLGRVILGEHATKAPRAFHTQFTFSDLLHKSQDLLVPMAVGSIPLALACWGVTYYMVWSVVKRSRQTRLERIHGISKTMKKKKG